MPIATPKKCFKCGKVKLIGDCIVGMPICDDCRNKDLGKASGKGGIKSALSDLIKEKFGKGKK